MKGAISILTLVLSMGVFAQESPSLADTFCFSDSNIKITHRYDLRTKIDGRYAGLYYGGGFGVWKWNSDGAVTAHYYLEEQGLRDTRHLEKKLRDDLTTSFRLGPEGRISEFRGSGGPLFRNFPYRPADLEFAPGKTWISQGEAVLDWDSSGILQSVPILTEYKVLGKKRDSQGEYWEITALHALRYKKSGPGAANQALESVQGRHESVIQWQDSQVFPRFYRIKVEEEVKSGGKTLNRSGFWLNWYHGVLPLGRNEVKVSIQETLEDAEIQDVRIETAEEGIKLILNNLQFVADQAVLLPGEEQRLEALAGIIRKIPGRSLMITGHTADVGRPGEQDRLSEERAKSIVEALKSRGIEPERLYFRGKGAREPLGDNSTAEGRALNRRVELTILED